MHVKRPGEAAEIHAGRISRREAAVLAAIVALGLAFRFWRISTAGLNHFDEGVYMLTGYGLSHPGEERVFYPYLLKFAPPVYWSLLGLAFRLTWVPLDTTAFVLQALLGSLTVLLTWKMAREWLGATAGVAAATMIAFHEVHIAYSRSAMTDIPFALVHLLSLYAAGEAIRRSSVRGAVLAGLAVGLAWNTKYHGWLGVLIAASALGPYIWFNRARGRDFVVRQLVLLGIMGLVALACYLPVVYAIETYMQGGYRQLARYQRSFLAGSWVDNLQQQARTLLFLEGPLTRCSIPAAFTAAVLVSGWKWSNRLYVGYLIALSAAALWLGGTATTALMALAAIHLLLRKARSFTVWLLLGALGAWFFSTPLYHPYNRLLLPLIVTAPMVAWGGLGGLFQASAQPGKTQAWRPALGLAATIGVLMASPGRLSEGVWRPSRGFAETVTAWKSLVPEGSRVIVFNEPHLAFYFHAAKRPAFERTELFEQLDNLPTPVFLVAAFYSRDPRGLRETLRRLGDRLVPLATMPVWPSDVRLMDDTTPAGVPRLRASHRHDVTLYRLMPKLQAGGSR